MSDKPIKDLTCRVCLNVEELMVNIYDDVEDFQSNLVELLEDCGGLVVNRSDNLPQYLCKICAGELLVAAKFREKCAKSNELFTRFITKAENLESAQLVYISHASDIEANSFDTISEEILNEIIIEEVEDKAPDIGWSAVALTDGETERAFDQCQVEGQLFVNEGDYIGGHESVVKSEMQSEDDVIGSDYEPVGYVVETIENKNANKSIKKKLQEAAPLKFDCDECGAAFSNHENLNRHLRIHPQFTGKLHICPNCLHSFTKDESLQMHLQASHFNDPLPEIIETRPSKRKARSEICPTCGKVCNSEASLKVHVRIHTGDRPYPCTECPKAFKTQAALSLHLKRHAGQFDWECEVCGKAFIESSNLRVHMRTHTGEKPHLCKVCGRKFSRVFLLQIHLRTHTGEKPYKCPSCTKAYSQKCDLDIHVRTHTGVRPYVCPICFRGFVKSYALQKHVRQHTPEVKLEIDT